MNAILSVTLIAMLGCSLAQADEAFATFSSLRLPTQNIPSFGFGFQGERIRDNDHIRADFETLEVEGDNAPAKIYSRASAAQIRFRHTFRMPAEFERQSALLVSGRLAEAAPDVLRELGTATFGCVPLLILINHQTELEDVELILTGAEGNGNRFVMVTHDTIWARDYGPTVLTGRNQSLVVDATYEVSRADDDAVPNAIARLTQAPARRTDLCVPGGNLLSNGAGLCVTTTRVQDENPLHTQDEIADIITSVYDANVVAILDPLEGETTGHVDMFLTFTDARTVVVGEYARHVDPENAAILDRNAAMLASLRVGNERLRVVRIPMPARAEGLWPTFTNVVYANGALLVPIYQSTTPREKQLVEALYASLLPGWKIHFIRADALIDCGGALHCVVSNLGPLKLDPWKAESELAPSNPILQPTITRRLATAR